MEEGAVTDREQWEQWANEANRLDSEAGLRAQWLYEALIELRDRNDALESEVESWRTGVGPCCEEMADTGGHHGQCHGWPK